MGLLVSAGSGGRMPIRGTLPRTPISVTPLHSGDTEADRWGGGLSQPPASLPGKLRVFSLGRRRRRYSLECTYVVSSCTARGRPRLQPPLSLGAERLTDKGFFLKCLTGDSLISL